MTGLVVFVLVALLVLELFTGHWVFAGVTFVVLALVGHRIERETR